MAKYSSKNIWVLIFLCFFFIPSSYAGGPWTKAKGKYYFKLSEWVLVFDKHYTDTGQLDPNITTGIYNTYLYGEYGLTDRWTAIFNGALLSRNYMNNLRSSTSQDILVKGGAVNSIGDIDLAIKYGLTKPGAKTPMALSLVLGLPTGVTAKGEFGNLQTGDGEFNQQIQFDIGQGFNLGKNSGYISALAALNHRTQGFSEEYKFGLEIGVGMLSQKLWLSSKLNTTQSFYNGDLASTVNSTSIFANNSEFTSLGVEANYLITSKVGLSVNYTSAFSGRIIAAAPSYSFGVFIDLK